MIRTISCTAVLCLLLTGCTGLGVSSRNPGAGGKLIPSRLRSTPSKESFIQAVAQDPFPKAGQGHVRP